MLFKSEAAFEQAGMYMLASIGLLPRLECLKEGFYDHRSGFKTQ